MTPAIPERSQFEVQPQEVPRSGSFFHEDITTRFRESVNTPRIADITGINLKPNVVNIPQGPRMSSTEHNRSGDTIFLTCFLENAAAPRLRGNEPCGQAGYFLEGKSKQVQRAIANIKIGSRGPDRKPRRGVKVIADFIEPFLRQPFAEHCHQRMLSTQIALLWFSEIGGGAFVLPPSSLFPPALRHSSPSGKGD